MIEFDEAAHRYTVGGVEIPSVTQVLAAVGISPSFEGVAPDVLEYAATRGQAVHVACDLLARGILDELTVAPEIAGYVEAFRRYLEQAACASLEAAEEIVYSRKWRYCGRIDRVESSGPAFRLLDMKTGASIDHSAAVQLAGYSLAWLDQTGIRFSQVCALHLRPDGTYRLLDLTAEARQAESLFLAALTVFNWRKANGRLD